MVGEQGGERGAAPQHLPVQFGGPHHAQQFAAGQQDGDGAARLGGHRLRAGQVVHPDVAGLDHDHVAVLGDGPQAAGREQLDQEMVLAIGGDALAAALVALAGVGGDAEADRRQDVGHHPSFERGVKALGVRNDGVQGQEVAPGVEPQAPLEGIR